MNLQACIRGAAQAACALHEPECVEWRCSVRWKSDVWLHACLAQVVSVDDEQPVKHSVRSLLTPARYQVIADEG